MSAPLKAPAPSNELVLVIYPRPQISVVLTGNGDVEVSVSNINEGFDRVDTDVIVLPSDCAREVAKAICSAAKRTRGGRG